VQEAGGHGLSEALGMAGAFNLRVVRNPSLSKAPYIVRLMWHQIIPLSEEKVANPRSPYSLFRELPARCLELRFGKFSMADFFDQNTHGTDTNFQFMNWTGDNNGAYDYAADTRGFTFGVMVEYHDRSWTLRFAEAFMPKVANGIRLDADMGRAGAENVESELRRRFVGKYPGTLRALSYANHANMGIYDLAVDQYLAGSTTTPEITAHPLQTTVKYGFGLNIEQPLQEWLGALARWGRNAAVRIVCVHRSRPDLASWCCSKWHALETAVQQGGTGVCEQCDQPSSPAVPCIWRSRIFAGRRTVDLWAVRKSWKAFAPSICRAEFFLRWDYSTW
jgi:hypothetical protein